MQNNLNIDSSRLIKLMINSYCLWVDAEEIGPPGCGRQESVLWSGDGCFKHGTCNVPCKAEGFDWGHCKHLTFCFC